MAEKRKLLELDIDVESILTKSVELKSKLDSLRTTQKELKDSGDTNSEAYIKLSAQISKVSSEYNINQKQLTNLAQVSGNYLSINQKVGLSLDKEINSISEARTNNAELLKIRNELNLSRADEKALADEINAKLDKNNGFIKENVSAYEKQKIGIGDYKTAITEAIGETGIFSGQLSGLKTVYDTGLKVLSPFKNDIIATATGMRASAVATEGMTTAQTGLTVATNIGTGAMRIFAIAVAATGIGAIIILVGLLIGYFKTLDPVVDKIEQVFAGFGGVLSLVTEKVGSFITGITNVKDLLSKLGSFFTDPIGSLKSFGKELANAAKEASNLKEREQDLEDQMTANSLLNKKQESEIARLMIQAKDRSKTQGEQNKAFADAERLNKEIFERNKKDAKEGLDIAIAQAQEKRKLTAQEIADIKSLDGAKLKALENAGRIAPENTKLLLKQFESQIDIENQANEQLDRITTKKNNALEKQEAANEAAAKKAEDKKNKLIEEAQRRLKAELDLFISQQGIRAKSMQEELTLAEQIKNKKIEIAKQEYEVSKKTTADKLILQTQENNIKNEFLKAQTDIVLANADRELKIFMDNNKSKLDANKFYTDEAVLQELDRLNRISEAEAEFQTQRLINGQINQQQYQDAIKAIDDQYEADKKVVLEEKAIEDATKISVDLENSIALDANNLELLTQKLDLERQAEVQAAEKSGADVNLINQKYKNKQATLENQAKITKIDATQQAFAQIGSIISTAFGEQKGLNFVLASMDAILGVQKAYLSQLVVGDPTSVPRAILAGVQAGVFGAANVAKIAGVKFAKGGVNIDGPGTGTSDSIDAKISKGESVITAEATANNVELLKAINANAGVDFSKQIFGSSTANIYNNTQSSQSIDYDLLAGKIAEANKSLPAPKVYTAVEDINLAVKNYAQVVEGANF